MLNTFEMEQYDVVQMLVSFTVPGHSQSLFVAGIAFVLSKKSPPNIVFETNEFKKGFAAMPIRCTRLCLQSLCF